ncbi:hypothetical protein HMPREF9623_00226 [Stomatobaculum longum]|uniref:Mannosyl-glycoprotein endo-beta-N-acetylglucosamidase-like domain-containing protein n=1 Tax=Stomatobaculum longum TaxID=796942 RepID=A0AA36Y6G8_9FIRM|nr:hypothetical protein [Stomatobaculum longum]EHO18042.1 hypothetical protein HMPREF9623_00226 [Stomatobaculum longum]
MKGKRARRIAQAGILILSLLTPFLPTQASQCFAAQKSDAQFEQQLAAEGFPESYKDKLRELHAKYPNWVFKAQKTGLSWQEVVREESKIGRNLVHTTSKDSWKSRDGAAYNAATNSWKGFDTSAWVAANSNIISYYMDPRNFLDSRYIFQFQTQGYDPDSQNAEGVRMLASNTFLSSTGLSPAQSTDSSVSKAASTTAPGSGNNTGTTASGGGSTQVASAKGKSPSAVTWTAPGTPRDSKKAVVGAAPLSAEEQQRKAKENATQPAVVTRGDTGSAKKEKAIGILAGAPHDKLVNPEDTASADEESAAEQSVTAAAEDTDSTELQADVAETDSVAEAETAAEAESAVTGETTEADLSAEEQGASETADAYEAAEVTASGESTGEAPAAVEDVAPYQLLEEESENQQFGGDVQAVIRRSATGATANTGKTDNRNSGTLSGDGSGSNPSGVDYITTIMTAASSSGVNPYVLTAMLIQEQGRTGGSGLISGKNPKFPGFYNYFNAQAFQDGDKTPTERGLWWASQVDATYGKPWDTPEKAIIGGAKYYGDNYLKSGQDTFYLKKFNVTAKGRYEHQYMTNVQAAAEEGRKLGEAYTEALKQKKHTFRIPVYTDMPENAAALPN